jgi:hypothetical protein
MNKADNKSEIVFILGIMPRSGTHFLANLLCQHPDCKKSVLAEDGLVASSSLLTRYADFNDREWEKDGAPAANNAQELLLKSIGDGLLTFLQNLRQNAIAKKASSAGTSPRYLVTKTPQVIGLENFFKLFPKNKLLILVRDGRAVIESGNISFNYDRERSSRQWRDAADTIIRFTKDTPQTPSNYLIVKYEELHTQTEQEMRKILSFMDLDPDKYDFEKASNMPVVGSSVFKRSDKAVSWLPVIKTTDFDPLARASGWTRKQHERFNRIAGPQLEYFGYQPVVFDGNKQWWLLYNRYLDTRENLARLIHKVARPLTRRFKALKNSSAKNE